MGVERSVVSVEYRLRMGQETPVYSFDYSSLGVGDWFILKGGSRIRSWRGSRNANPVAKSMQFETEPYGRVSMRVTRVA
jgi:hypothetical protein